MCRSDVDEPAAAALARLLDDIAAALLRELGARADTPVRIGPVDFGPTEPTEAT